MPRDQNGNEISDEDRINRNMARFLSTEKQQKQLLLCLRQQEMPKRLRMGKLTSMKVAYGHEAYLDHAVELLEPDLKPIPPQPNCPESMQVYEEHRLMAANYLDVQQQLEDVRNYNKELEDQLEASEIEMNKVAAETDSEEGKKFVQLQKEKDSLMKLRDNMSKQLHMITTAQQEQNHDSGGVVERTPPTTNLEEDWVLVHGSASASASKRMSDKKS